ncbi:MAG: ribosome biogenesis GTP-binding protein YihA/YsxC [Ureaplasma sp.]|nr:ribosome biogenesis GTP-binding protein YihA/YsxC [Ureaplasma sp.]
MVKFIKSANFVSEYFEDKRKQICFVGRSNAGKSSLINALANQNISKVSSTPGKTQLVNFFDFDNIVLVDLPGYGYAKTSKSDSEKIQSLIFEYLNYSKKLSAIFQLCSVDVITEQDLQISFELKKISNKFNLSYFLVLTKIDKIKFGKLKEQLKNVQNSFHLDTNDVVCISSKQKININIIKSIINKLAKK